MTCSKLLSIAASAALILSQAAYAQGASSGGMGTGTGSPTTGGATGTTKSGGTMGTGKTTGTGSGTMGTGSGTMGTGSGTTGTGSGTMGTGSTTGGGTTGKGGAMGTNSPTGGGTTSPGAGGMAASDQGGDKEILSQIHMANQMEIDMGKLAKSHAKSKAVKDYAGQMMKDHGQADQQVMALAKKEKITLEKMPASPDEQADHKAGMDAMEKLKTLKGEEFDRAYMTQMAQDHQKVLGKLQAAQGKAVKSGDLVSKLIPQIQKHQDEAQKIQGELK